MYRLFFTLTIKNRDWVHKLKSDSFSNLIKRRIVILKWTDFRNNITNKNGADKGFGPVFVEFKGWRKTALKIHKIICS